MSNIFEKIVNHLSIKNQFSTIDVSRDLDMKHDQVVDVIRLVHKIGDFFILSDKCQESWDLTENGLKMMELRRKSKATSARDDAEVSKPYECDKETYFNLNFIRNGGSFDNECKLDYYKLKNLIKKTQVKYIEGEVINGEALSNLKLEYCVTNTMLENDNWKNISLLPYNFDTMAPPIATGSIHRVTRMLNKLRQILLEIGFTEKPSTPLIDDPFWNNEAMLADSSTADEVFCLDFNIDRTIPKEFHDRLRTSKSDLFNDDTLDVKTVTPILRHNLNNIVARLLYQAARNDQFPIYQFVIGNIVSWKTSDYLHLPEYHMASVILINTHLKFNDILGLLHAIFKKLKVENVEYKAAYASYSSPTLESLCYHYGLDQWVRIGKSGIVSRELMKAMNFQGSYVALVLTMNIERLIMVQQDLLDISDVIKLASD